MPPMQALMPSTRLIPRYRAGLKFNPLIQHRRNHGLPPRVPQYFPQQPMKPPQYFSKDTGASSKSTAKLAIIFSFLLGGFIGHNVQRNEISEKFEFNCISTEIARKFGRFNLDANCELLTEWAKKKGLGEIIGLPRIADPQEAYPFLEEDPPESAEFPTEPLSEAENRMLEIVWKMINGLRVDPTTWAVSFWHATNGDYSKFARVVPLIKTYPDGQSLIHKDTLDLLGSDDCFAFAMARNMADVIHEHQAVRISASILGFLGMSLLSIPIFRKTRSFSKRASALVPLLFADWIFLTWISRKAEMHNDIMGFVIIHSCGFDGLSAIKALRKLDHIENQPRNQNLERLPEFLLLKPKIATRIKFLVEAAAYAQAFEKMVDESEKLMQEAAKDDEKSGNDNE